MKIGIMQPYFLPYIGYWQLINAVDKYVVYDDVQFIKGGWINRNRILREGKPTYLNLPMLGASPNKLIKEVCVNTDRALTERNMRIVTQAYHKAPYFESVYKLFETISSCKQTNIAIYLMESIHHICTYLNIQTELILSSQMKKNNNLRGQERVLDICQRLGATTYLNAIGGMQLYRTADFAEKGISLKFLKTNPIEYPQFGGVFQPNLSILDVMMFCSVEEIQNMLTQYSLLTQ